MTKSIIEQHMGSCIHFQGIQHETCKAGINWRVLTGGDNFGIAKRMPCIASNDSTIQCSQCRYPTLEEAQAHETEIEQHMERRRAEMGVVSEAHKGKQGTSTAYICLLCERGAQAVETSSAAISGHITEAHGVTMDEIKAARGQMAAHLDAAEWFQTDDRFTLPDGRALLLRSTRIPRRGADKAIWAGKKRKTR